MTEPSRRTLRTALPIALITGLLAAGCGTTVPLSEISRSASDQPAGSATGSGTANGTASGGSGQAVNGGGVASPPGRGATKPGASPAASAATGRDTPAATTSRSGVAPGSSPTGSSSAEFPAQGQGWDAKHVYVGITTASDASNTLHTLGIAIDPGDEIADANAIVADLNRRGGIFGRQVVLIDKDDHSADVVANPAAAGQSDCLYFTQDHPVIDVVNTDAALDSDTFRSCFAHAHMPLVSLTTSPFDDQSTQSLAPYFYNALSVSWSRLTPVLMTRLQAQNYFSGWNTVTGSPVNAGKTKVGVLYGNDPSSIRDGGALLAALQKAGYATDYFEYTNAEQDAQSAVLRFEQDAVTHVIGIDSAQFFFMTAARSQHYLPRYGITTYNGPQALLQANGDPAQLAGAVGLGWYPSLDTDQAHDPGPGPGTKECLQALAAGGQTFTGRFAEAFGLAVCDGIHLAAFGAQAGGGLSPAAVRAGIVRLGAHFPAGGPFASGLSSTNFGLPGTGRDLVWDSNCSCFTYRGPTYNIGWAAPSIGALTYGESTDPTIAH